MASTSRRLPTPEEREKWKHIFDTTIDPNLAPIEIPQPFFNKMKSEFIKHTFGWIRGPKKMKFMVRYLQSNSGIKLSSGVCVSRYFGFVIPTRVTLSYVIDENTFWMRIYPPLQPVKTEFPPEPNLKIRASQRKKDLKSTPKKSNKQHQYKHSRRPVIVKLNLDGSYGWEKIVTGAGAADARPQVMHFPKQLSRLFLGEKQNKMLVQAGAGDTFSCKIITARRNIAEKYISKEWSKFVRRNNLQVGDKLIFTLQNPPTKLLIQIIRCSVHN
ncbi:hypothetical protein P8452_61104 [Trifolium repens]|nr:hypothetical protein P8452_61104 [Trifolium repens]